MGFIYSVTYLHASTCGFLEECASQILCCKVDIWMAMIHCGQTCGILDHRVWGKTFHTEHIYEACSEDDKFYLALQ